MLNPVYSDDFLMHHGIMGMKWGVRRYQNPDGSLTEAGRKRYDRMSDKKLTKTFHKQIRSARQEEHGASNRFMFTKTFGKKNAEEAFKKQSIMREKALSEPDSKKAISKMKELEKRYGSDNLWPEQAVKEYDAAQSILAKKTDDLGYAKRVMEIGKGFSEKFVNGIGKEISIAKLKDVGYDEKTAKKYVERLAKSNISLAWA